MRHILFVCTANRLRSPLAAGFFAARMQKRIDMQDWRVESAGTWAEPGLPADSLARQMAQKYGVDLSAHRSRPISEQILQDADLVLVMEAGQKEALQIEFPDQAQKVLMLSEAAEDRRYDIQDPVGMDRGNYQVTVDDLYAIINRGFNLICEKAVKINPGR